MNLLMTLAIAVGLSMDAFAVAVNAGLILRPFQLSKLLKLSLFFGGFQAGMPLLGYLTGNILKSWIASVDHWIAFGLLSFVGAKMIYEGLQPKEPDARPDLFSTKTLFLLAVATSIDAFAVGITFSFYQVSVLAAAGLIGITTFSLSAAGVFIGHRIGHFFEKSAEIAGGIVLILSGLKMLF